MKKILFYISAFCLTASGWSQNDPNVISWQLNTSGQLGFYESWGGPPFTGPTSSTNMTDSVGVLSVCYNTNNIYVRTNSLGYHNMGPWTNPNVPSAQDYIYKFPRNPVEETGVKTEQSAVGPLGFGVDGVCFYGISDARSYDGTNNNGPGLGIWNTNAWVTEGETMDATGNGHPQQQGAYHYHANPVQLYDDPATAHSSIIGWAYDGFPIYGPFGYSDSLDASSAIVRIESSYILRNITDRTTLSDGTVLTSAQYGPSLAAYDLGTYIEDYEFISGVGHLDAYNGRYCVTPDFPGGTYAYFATTDAMGDPAFPYIIGTHFYGEVPASSLINNLPANAVCWDGNVAVAPTISSQPTNQTGCEGDNFSFSTTYSGTADSVRWYSSTNGTNWSVVVNGGGISGANTTNLNISGANVGLDGTEYACYLYYDNGSNVITDGALIEVNANPSVTLANFSQSSICDDDNPIALPAGIPSGGTYSGSGIVGSTFDPSQTGVGSQTITYTYSLNGCSGSATSSIIVETCLSVDGDELDFHVYPNPVNEVLNIRTNGNVQSVQIYDASGKIVKSKIINDQTNIELDFSDLSSGLYFIGVNSIHSASTRIVKL